MAQITALTTAYTIQALDGVEQITAEVTENIVQGLDGVVIEQTAANLSLTATTALSGHRAIATDNTGGAVYADSSDLNTKHSIVGISTGAATLGDSVTVQYSGNIINAGWLWTEQEPVFITTSGNLTQTAPTTGYRVIVGYAINATTVFLNISEPIVL